MATAMAGPIRRIKRSFTCAVVGCGKAYGDRKSLWRHTQRRHADPAAWRHACARCGERFVTRQSLELHVDGHARADQHAVVLERAGSAARVLEEATAARAAEAAAITALGALRAMAEALAGELAAAIAASEQAAAALAAARPHADEPTVEEAVGAGCCRVCRLERGANGAVPRVCGNERCGALVHSLCVCYLELPLSATFFCGACLAKYGFGPCELEHAAFEDAGLPRALVERRLRRVPVAADGHCFFTAVALATQGAHGDAEALRRRAAKAVQELARWARGKASAKARLRGDDERHWREVFYHFHDERWLEEVLATAPRLLCSTLLCSQPPRGEAWNSAAMDLVPMVMPAIVRRPIQVWSFNYRLRGLPEEPQTYPVRQLADDQERLEGPAMAPIALCLTKASVKLPHYDLLLPT